jgi:serine/threonine protein kinase
METAVIANMTTVIDAAATERVGIPFGRYVLLERIASGGMGEIFLARQRGNTGLARLVAVKRILQHYTSDKNHVRMFFDEARLQSLLSDRHVVQIYDMGECDEHLYIAMEFVLGVSLRRLVHKVAESGLYLHPAHACDLAVQICRGLSYAHNVEDGQGRPLSIVHRDVNPQNILVSYDGEVKIIDFGIAKSEMSDVKTETGTLKGKLTYMSPEQARGEKLDRRSDIFSTGICFYEMLTGKNPFDVGNVILSLQAIEADPVPPITTVRGDCVGFEDILQGMLAKDPDARFNDAADVVSVLVERYSAGVFGEPAMPLGDFMLRVFHDEIQARLARLEGFGVKMAVRRRPVGEPARLAHAYALGVETSDPSRKRLASPAPSSVPQTNPGLLVSRVGITAEQSSSTSAGEPVSISQGEIISSEIYDSDTAIAMSGSSQLSRSMVSPVDIDAPLFPRAPDAPEKEPVTEPTHSGTFPLEALATEPPSTSRRALAAGVAVGVTLGAVAFVLLAVMPDVIPAFSDGFAAPSSEDDAAPPATGTATTTDDLAPSVDDAALAKTDPSVTEEKPGDVPVVADAENANPGAIAEKPAVDKPQDPDAPDDAPVAVLKSDVEKLAVEKPDVEKPAAEKPAVEKPAVEKPAVEKPAVEKPAVEKPAARSATARNDRDPSSRGGKGGGATSTTSTSAATEPRVASAATASKPLEKTPAVEKPVVEKPAAASGPSVKLALRVSGGYVLAGRGVSGDSASLSVDDTRKFKLTPPESGGLTVSVTATPTESGVELSITSEPWAIVRVDNLGRGRTPQRVVVKRGDRAEIFLKSPAGGEVGLVVKAN